jgi:putative transposase
LFKLWSSGEEVIEYQNPLLQCKIEICRDTNAAIYILKKGMGILGMDWQNSTFGQKESGSEDRKLGEKTASVVEGKPDTASGFQ